MYLPTVLETQYTDLRENMIYVCDASAIDAKYKSACFVSQTLLFVSMPAWCVANIVDVLIAFDSRCKSIIFFL